MNIFSLFGSEIIEFQLQTCVGGELTLLGIVIGNKLASLLLAVGSLCNALLEKFLANLAVFD